ncbi:response regulator transcription factor [Desulfitobacterium sp.]|uniref:response regulator transcription factor n=1 Tax=Desulfitobacterium sp. TaxID=49981 RepID=UPI002C87028A|nr:LuxR C-terminal-related transcriptional regulator [Desulfitobacterium sp.]HVJ49728.1 LuxR C-terminal-related transcriptional regulator [Desulfitobacterium sp.]
MEVLQLIGKGYANKEIALSLYITESTVKKHVRNIFDKLHLRNRVEVAIYAKNQEL